ncbi:hypothetical protein JCM8547_001686 [Rhodosporidiobolus lusitaniae]
MVEQDCKPLRKKRTFELIVDSPRAKKPRSTLNGTGKSSRASATSATPKGVKKEETDDASSRDATSTAADKKPKLEDSDGENEERKPRVKREATLPIRSSRRTFEREILAMSPQARVKAEQDRQALEAYQDQVKNEEDEAEAEAKERETTRKTQFFLELYRKRPLYRGLGTTGHGTTRLTVQTNLNVGPTAYPNEAVPRRCLAPGKPFAFCTVPDRWYAAQAPGSFENEHSVWAGAEGEDPAPKRIKGKMESANWRMTGL